MCAGRTGSGRSGGDAVRLDRMPEQQRLRTEPRASFAEPVLDNIHTRHADPAARKRFHRETVRRLGADGRLGAGCHLPRPAHERYRSQAEQRLGESAVPGRPEGFHSLGGNRWPSADRGVVGVRDAGNGARRRAFGLYQCARKARQPAGCDAAPVGGSTGHRERQVTGGGCSPTRDGVRHRTKSGDTSPYWTGQGRAR
ncbi:hypothetical protein GCM10027162_30110 [Streptomyces incanus]